MVSGFWLKQPETILIWTAQHLTACSSPGAGRLFWSNSQFHWRNVHLHGCCVEFALDCNHAFPYPGQWDTSPQREAFHLEG